MKRTRSIFLTLEFFHSHLIFILKTKVKDGNFLEPINTFARQLIQMKFASKTLLVMFVFAAQLIYAANTFYSDTIQLDLKATEKRFLEQNLDLLIAKTNIDEAKGYLLQSKLFDNPEVDLNRELYN